MMRRSILLSAAVIGVALVGTAGAMKGLLEKKVWYESRGKVGETTYWVVYMGEYKCALARKFPGEDKAVVDASVNFNLLSSGYIEGTGYSAKGKIDARADLAIRTAEGDRDVPFEQVDCIYDFGRRIRLTDGTDGEFLLDIESTMTPVKKMQLRVYKYREVDGDRTLKEDGENTDLPLAVFAFSKAGLDAGRKAGSSAPASGK